MRQSAVMTVIHRDHAADPTPKGSQWIWHNHTHARDRTRHGSENKVASEIQEGSLYMASRLEGLQSLRPGFCARNQLVSVVQRKLAMGADHHNANRHRQKICRAHRHRWDQRSNQCSADVQEPFKNTFTDYQSQSLFCPQAAHLSSIRGVRRSRFFHTNDWV